MSNVSIRELFFSWHGTIGRGSWWLGVCALVGGTIVGLIALGVLLLWIAPIGPVAVKTFTTANGLQAENRTSVAMNVAGAIWLLAAVVCFMMLSAKRLRDARISPALLALVPLPILLVVGLPLIREPSPGGDALAILLVALACYGPLWVVLGFKPSAARDPLI
ncbi:DUF805 domain-containing protein [Aureimonas pseudogalii]|uniref:Uncharacterized membrane protein YhaH (DUF805 family) n=1 Tax=Aureimonas pseudogalii TaxID=1744844 RepID=A0A7W6H335_9HYPH|nr:hypothetical protein [Aureimonas pseudogalii]MBB3996468.1 uncharacterized membrane protein YhaH (DUF805 family) [Aureimonas pseudogalii]